MPQEDSENVLPCRDKPTEDIDEAITDRMIVEAARYVVRDFQPTLDRICLPPGVVSRTVQGEDAAAILRSCIEAATAALERITRGYSSVRWLWMLRRLPRRVFEGELSTTLGYDSGLAEVVSSSGSGRSRPLRLDNAIRAYPLDNTVVKRVLRYAAAARRLSQLHTDYRWVGKGASITFRRGRWPNEILADDLLRASVRLYDKRAELGGPGARMGTDVFQMVGSSLNLAEVLAVFEARPVDMLIRLVAIDRAFPFPVPAPDADISQPGYTRLLVHAKYMPVPVTLDQLEKLINEVSGSATSLFDKPAAALLYLLAWIPGYAMVHRAGLLGMLTTGYLLSERRLFEENIRDDFSSVPEFLRGVMASAGVHSADDVLEQLDAVRGNTWPLAAGPILRHENEVTAVDFVAASRRLESSIEFPRIQGPVANARAEHFEDRVQHALDESRWAPVPEARQLRRRTLRVGRDLTDVDAIGSFGDTVLLVSCKSLVYTSEYDQGEYRAVRNAATVVRDAKSRWDAVIAVLRQHPRGDNYDLRSYARIVGVVCTPSAIWIEMGPATEFVVGNLRAVSSLAELREWLKQ